MALDKPVVTHNLPDLFGNSAAPPIDPDAALVQHVVDVMIRFNGKLANILIDSYSDMAQLSWVAAMFCGIGVAAVGVLVVSYVLHGLSKMGEARRHGRTAERLARLAWDELSPADVLYAERHWPEPFALARYIDGRRRHRDARSRWLDPDLTGTERVHQRWEFANVSKRTPAKEHLGGWLHDEAEAERT